MNNERQNVNTASVSAPLVKIKLEMFTKSQKRKKGKKSTANKRLALK